MELNQEIPGCNNQFYVNCSLIWKMCCVFLKALFYLIKCTERFFPYFLRLIYLHHFPLPFILS